MRFGPLWGFVILIGAAILVAGIGSNFHPNRGDTPPVEKQQEEDQQKADEAKKAADATKASMLTFDQAKEGAVKVAMEIEGKGTIAMELYPKAAPKTVAHFTDLCKKHFYDGLKFHRVVPNFVIQVGDPNSKGLDGSKMRDMTNEAVSTTFKLGGGGSGEKVPLEAKLSHKKYSVGLARSDAPDSGDSQFYINLQDNLSLDGNYCVFGMVLHGQDVAAKIQKGDVIKSLTLQ